MAVERTGVGPLEWKVLWAIQLGVLREDRTIPSRNLWWLGEMDVSNVVVRLRERPALVRYPTPGVIFVTELGKKYL